MKKYLLLCLLFFIYNLTVHSQEIEWEMTIGGRGKDEPTSITKIDSNFFISGFTSSKGNGDYDGWLIKIDGGGKVLWDSTYGSIAGDIITSVIPINKEGFAACGFTGGESPNPWVLKLDSKGSIEWEKAFVGETRGEARSINFIRDASYLISGMIDIEDGNNTNGWLAKINSSGTAVWEMSLPDSILSVTGLTQSTDGGFVLTGTTVSMTKSGTFGYIMKLDSSNLIVWQRSLGHGASGFTSIVRTSDNGYLVCGVNDFRSMPGLPGTWGGSSSWVVKFDSTGLLLWDKEPGDSGGDDFLYSIIESSDSSYIGCGAVITKDQGFDAYVVKLNHDGSIRWKKKFGGKGDHWATSICESNDHGYVFCGVISSAEADNTDIWVCKIR